MRCVARRSPRVAATFARHRRPRCYIRAKRNINSVRRRLFLPGTFTRASGRPGSKNPKFRLRHLEPMPSGRERALAISAQTLLAEREEVLPFVAEIHRCRQVGGDPVVAGTFGDAYPLETDHSDPGRARLRASLRGAPQLPSRALE